MKINVKKMNVIKRFVKVPVLVLLAATLYFSFGYHYEPDGIIKVSPFGKQPAISTDGHNSLHVVFGQEDEIFYTVSRNGGASFTTPQRIAQQTKLALGMTRGPQITTTKDYTVIIAADHTGKIMVYRLKNNETVWSKPVNILKEDSTAKEGFVAIASGRDNIVYAAWLDLRLGKGNSIFSAFSHDGGKTWSENKLVYDSPEGGICPCCRPSIAADKKGNVDIMFRNELKGARDLYVAHSKDGAGSFRPPQKMGTGTWIFDKCPMDGGAVSMDAKGKLGTTWRRENTVYYSEPGMPEQKIGEGRAPSLAKNSKGSYVAWQQGNHIMALTPGNPALDTIGTGIYPRLVSLHDERVFCFWESDGQILAKKLMDFPPSGFVKVSNKPSGSANSIAVGKSAPDITLPQPDGSLLSLTSLKGKYVLIDFWASWCRPCRQENPRVVKLYDQYKDKGFEILGVSLDESKDQWLKAIEKDQVRWRHVSDLKGLNSPAVQLYHVQDIPQTILLDKEGKIIAMNLRGELLEKKLASLLP